MNMNIKSQYCKYVPTFTLVWTAANIFITGMVFVMVGYPLEGHPNLPWLSTLAGRRVPQYFFGFLNSLTALGLALSWFLNFRFHNAAHNEAVRAGNMKKGAMYFLHYVPACSGIIMALCVFFYGCFTVRNYPTVHRDLMYIISASGLLSVISNTIVSLKLLKLESNSESQLLSSLKENKTKTLYIQLGALAVLIPASLYLAIGLSVSYSSKAFNQSLVISQYAAIMSFLAYVLSCGTHNFELIDNESDSYIDAGMAEAKAMESGARVLTK